jgi:hypothetical protein
MGEFILGKIPLGKNPYSTYGYKLPLKKIDQRLGSVRVNSASGAGIRLYDKNYGSRFPDGTVGLEGYAHRRLVGITPAVGADANGMQMVGFKVYYGSGQDADGVAYLGGWCRWDFNDCRFGSSDGTEYKIRRRNIVEGVSCDIDVLVPLNLNVAQNVYLYFGNELAAAADDDDTFEAVIPNVAGAWTMDEGDVGYVAGFLNKKSLQINAGVDCGTDYQVIIKVCKGTGTDGTTTYNGETVPVVYLGTKVRDDFCDVRFKHAVNHTSYLFKKTSYVSGEYAIFVVKVTESLDVNQLIEVVYNNPTASTDYSSDSASVAVINDVALACPMDEIDREVNPTVIYNGEEDFWATFQQTVGNYGGVLTQEADGVKVIITEGAYQSVGVAKNYSSNQDWSTKQVIRVTFEGENSGETLRMYMADASFKSSDYNVVDDRIGERTVSFVLNTHPVWDTIKSAVRYFRI